MSFLSSILGSRNNEEAENGNEPEYDATVFPQLAKGTSLVVTYADTGRPLLSGRLASLVDGELTVERSPGQFSFETCDIGTEVFLRGFNGASPFDLKGIVQLSNRVQFRVNDLRAVPHDEQRGSFRLPLSVPVSLYYQEDTRLQNPEKCRLVNISTGGACVESEFIHADGEILRLRVQIDEYAPMSFLGQIIRLDEPKPGLFRYGFLYAQLNEQETATLTRMLYNLQVGNRRPWQRNQETGVWE